MKKKVTKAKQPSKAKFAKASKPAPKTTKNSTKNKGKSAPRPAVKAPPAPKRAPSRSTAPISNLMKPAARPIQAAQPASAPQPAEPLRAPMRKILGRDSSSSVVIEKPSSVVIPVVAESPKPIQKPAREVSSIPVVKRAWNQLPLSIPSQYRFLVASSQKECEKAAAWPFPFAKLIASLPTEICGFEFALLVMRLDHSFESVHAVCGLTEDALEDALLRGGAALEDKCAAICPEISRKLRSHLSGTRSATAALIEPNKIAQVDWPFQVMLADMIIMSLKGVLAVREDEASIAQASSGAA